MYIYTRHSRLSVKLQNDGGTSPMHGNYIYTRHSCLPLNFRMMAALAQCMSTFAGIPTFSISQRCSIF